MEPPPFLPEDLQLQILSWLPVKSLLRFRCVSQSWNSTISDSQFIKLHLHRSSSRTGTNVDFVHLHLLISSPSESRSATTVAIPHGYASIGTCNGLICLRTSSLEYDGQNHSYSYLFCFWNPATRSISQQSLPLCISTRTRTWWSLWFGYDSSTDAYKLVVLTFALETMLNVYNMGGHTCWRTIQVPLHLPRMFPRGDAVYVSNTLNWLANFLDQNNGTQLMNSHPYAILSFDLGKEQNYAQSLPYCPQVRSFPPILGVLRGCLCICQTYEMTTCFEIWQMKKFGVHESWTRLFNIAGYGYIVTNIIKWRSFTMYMSENGDALLLSDVSQPRAVLYTQKDNKLEVTKITSYIVDCYVNNYIESLVPPC